MYYNVCNYTPSTWYAFQLLSEAFRRLGSPAAENNEAHCWRWPVHHWLSQHVWGLSVQRPHGHAHTHLLIYQRVFPSTTLVVPLGLLASQRGWNLLYSLGAWPLHCGRGGGVLHHHETLLVVPHYGQSASAKRSFPDEPLGQGVVVQAISVLWKECPRNCTSILSLALLLASSPPQ